MVYGVCRPPLAIRGRRRGRFSRRRFWCSSARRLSTSGAREKRPTGCTASPTARPRKGEMRPWKRPRQGKGSGRVPSAGRAGRYLGSAFALIGPGDTSPTRTLSPCRRAMRPGRQVAQRSGPSTWLAAGYALGPAFAGAGVAAASAGAAWPCPHRRSLDIRRRAGCHTDGARGRDGESLGGVRGGTCGGRRLGQYNRTNGRDGKSHVADKIAD